MESLRARDARGREGSRRGSAELKGSTLLRSRAGREEVRALIRELNTRQVPVTLVLQQKVALAAIALLERCTMPAANRSFPQDRLPDMASRQRLVQMILDHGREDLLEAVWRARLSGDRTAVEASHREMLASLSASREPELASLALEMSRADLAAAWETESLDGLAAIDRVPNTFAFFSSLLTCQQQAEQIGVADVEVIHDIQDRYQVGLSQVWRLTSVGAAQRLDLPGRGDPITIPGSSSRLLEPTFRDSRVEPDLQLADVLSSAMQVAAREATGTPEKSERFIADLAALVFSTATNRTGLFYLGSLAWKQSLERMLQTGVARLPLEERRLIARVSAGRSGSRTTR